MVIWYFMLQMVSTFLKIPEGYLAEKRGKLKLIGLAAVVASDRGLEELNHLYDGLRALKQISGHMFTFGLDQGFQ